MAALCAWMAVSAAPGPRLNYKSGDLVRTEIIAPEHVSVPDPDRTEALRAAEAEAVVPVFDYAPYRGAQMVEQLRATLVRLAAAYETARAAPDPQTPAEFAAVHRDEFPLGDEALLELFARKGFDPWLIDEIVRVLERRSSGYIIPDDAAAVAELRVHNAVSGETYPLFFRDVVRLSAAKAAARSDLLDVGGLTPAERGRLSAALEPLISVTLEPDEARIEKARNAARARVEEVRDEYQAGQIIAYRNQRVDARIERAIAELRARYRAPDQLVRWAGLASLLVILLFALWRASERPERSGLTHQNAFQLTAVLLLGQLAFVWFGLAAVERLGNLPAAAGLDTGPQYLYALPIAIAPLVVALLVDGRLGLIVGLAAAPLLAIVTAAYPGGGLAFGVYVAAVTAVGSQGSSQYRSRMVLVQAAFVLCATQALAAAAVAVLFGNENRSPRAVFTTVGLSLIGALLTAAVSALLIPVLERAFHIVSDVRLLELANADHKLLRALAIEAPGTHQHSYVMSSVATEAAKAIGANPQLARIGAYFHDVGKLHAPEMFVENQQGGPNPHDALEPGESARLIIRHVSYGIELARREGLPPQVLELITGHHGTRTLHFFLEKARRQATEGVDVDESLFRYPGPKPQTKESAILMLADGSEAAVRSLDEPSRDQVEALIRKITDTVIADGQLDECGITLEEVARVREAIVDTLLSLHHRRVKYPGFNPPAPPAVEVREASTP